MVQVGLVEDDRVKYQGPHAPEQVGQGEREEGRIKGREAQGDGRSIQQVSLSMRACG